MTTTMANQLSELTRGLVSIMDRNWVDRHYRTGQYLWWPDGKSPVVHFTVGGITLFTNYVVYPVRESMTR